MTYEEKESIEQLKSWREYIIKHKETVNKANDIEFYLRTVLNLIQKQDTEINKLKQENERLKYSCAKATEIIDEYADETENDTKKLIEYQEKYLNNKGKEK